MKHLVVDISTKRKLGGNLIISCRLSDKLMAAMLQLTQDDGTYRAEITWVDCPNPTQWKIIGDDRAICRYGSSGWGSRTIGSALFRARACYSKNGVQIELQYPVAVQDLKRQLQDLREYANQVWRAHVAPFSLRLTTEAREVC